MNNQLTARIRGEIGNTAKITVSYVSDEAAAVALAQGLANLSDGVLLSDRYSSGTDYAAATPAVGSNSDRVLICQFKAVGDGSIHHVSIPAPKATTYEAIPGEGGGERATAATMTTVLGLLNTNCDKQYTAVKGWVIQKR